MQTAYAQDRYGLPQKYLALTSDESEGMYLYGKDAQALYDVAGVDLEGAATPGD